MCALEAEEGFATASDGRRIFFRVGGKGPFVLVMPPNWGVDSYVYTRGSSPLEFWLALVTFDPRRVGVRSRSILGRGRDGNDGTGRRDGRPGRLVGINQGFQPVSCIVVGAVLGIWV